jgi:hypothetical protein
MGWRCAVLRRRILFAEHRLHLLLGEQHFACDDSPFPQLLSAAIVTSDESLSNQSLAATRRWCPANRFSPAAPPQILMLTSSNVIAMRPQSLGVGAQSLVIEVHVGDASVGDELFPLARIAKHATDRA